MDRALAKRDERLGRIQAQLAWLQERSEIVGQRSATWGIVGDLGHIEDTLEELITFWNGGPRE